MDYSLSGLVNTYNNYKEQYDPNVDPANATTSNAAFLGLTLGLFITVIIVAFGIWAVALFLLIKYWKVLPQWAKVLGILGVIPVVPFGPIVTIVVVLVGKQQ
jgi:hypothetical protein